MSPSRLPYRSLGVTLVELLVVIVLLGILGVVGSSMIANTFDTTRIIDSGNASEASARYAIERVGRELREVSYTGVDQGFSLKAFDGSAINANPVSNLRFTRLMLGAGGVLTPVTVTVRLDGSNLRLGYSNASEQILLSQVGAFSLTFYTAARAQITNAARIPFDTAFVAINLTVGSAGQQLTQSLWIGLRNE